MNREPIQFLAIQPFWDKPPRRSLTFICCLAAAAGCVATAIAAIILILLTK